MYQYSYLPNKKETRKKSGKTKCQITKVNCAILIKTIVNSAVQKKKEKRINLK